MSSSLIHLMNVLHGFVGIEDVLLLCPRGHPTSCAHKLGHSHRALCSVDLRTVIGQFCLLESWVTTYVCH